MLEALNSGVEAKSLTIEALSSGVEVNSLAIEAPSSGVEVKRFLPGANELALDSGIIDNYIQGKMTYFSNSATVVREHGRFDSTYGNDEMVKMRILIAHLIGYMQ